MQSLIGKIVSGGQTGADRAALDWAIAQRIPHGGWCPAGRKAEDGAISSRYQLKEMPCNGGYLKRTKSNVRDSDGTLILSLDVELTGGSLQTQVFADKLSKPCLHLYPDMNWSVLLGEWIAQNEIKVLNVAGPRASGASGIERFVTQVLDTILT